MTTTGRDLLGRNLYDILSPGNPQVMTIGNTSNDAFLRFYSCNLPEQNAYFIGLSNQTFVINNVNLNSFVGINTTQARTTLDVRGTLAADRLTTYSAALNATDVSLSNLRNAYINQNLYYKERPVALHWSNVVGTEQDMYTDSLVGIGTTMPEYKLDVGGSIQFSDYLYRNGEIYRESPFRYVEPTSNIYFMNSVGIGLSSSNLVSSYKMFISGDAVVDGKLYANDFVIYSGESAAVYKDYYIYGIDPYTQNKTIDTSGNSDSNVLYEFNVKASQYLLYINLPYKNLSSNVYVNGRNWFDVVLVGGRVSDYDGSCNVITKSQIEMRTSNIREVDTVELFLESPVEAYYTIAIRGYGHVIEFGGIEGGSELYDSRLRVIPLRNIGSDRSFNVRKNMQMSPIRSQFILTEYTSNFTFTTEGYYTAEASNVDVFINGLKYVYYTDARKDYDITHSYNFDNNTTTFLLTLSEMAQTNDVVDIAVWPYATADTLYASGYYYQQINQYPTQWLNVVSGQGVRYPKDVIVDGNLIVRGNIVGGCNTDIFYAGLPTGDLVYTCNVVGTTNIIDGSIMTSKIGPGAVTNSRIADYTIKPSKFAFKNEVVVIGCNQNEVEIVPEQLPKNRGVYVEGDVYVTGTIQAALFAGNQEGIADLSVTTRKLANNAVTFEKLGLYSVSNVNLVNGAVDSRVIGIQSVARSNIGLGAVGAYQIGIGGVARSNIQFGAVSSNELAVAGVRNYNLDLVSGNVGIGTTYTLAAAKLHVQGDSILNGGVRPLTNGTFSLGRAGFGWSNLWLNGLILEKNGFGGLSIGNGSNLVKNRLGETVFAGNLGIGTDFPRVGLDVIGGGLVSGNLGIGTTVARSGLDVIGKIIGNEVGIGTAVQIEPLTVWNGGLYVNSNDEVLSFRSGNLGIGATVSSYKLQVEGTAAIKNTLFTCNLVPLGPSNLIGTAGTPYLDIQSKRLSLETGYLEKLGTRVYSGDAFTAVPMQYSNRGMVFNGSLDFANYYPYRNKVINGEFRVQQKTVGSNFTLVQGQEAYLADRFTTRMFNSSASLNVTHSNIGVYPAIAYTVGIGTATMDAGSLHTLWTHKIENTYTKDLGWGGVGALPVCISFDLVSSTDHVCYLAVQNFDRSRSLVRTVAVSASNTPTRYSYTIPGPVSGDWKTGTSESAIGIILSLNNGVGNTYVAPGENSWQSGEYYGLTETGGFLVGVQNTVFISRIQLEIGNVPTVYEQRPFLAELDLCRRYYEKSYNYTEAPGTVSTQGLKYIYCATSTAGANNWVNHTTDFKTPKRNSDWTGRYFSAAGTEGILSYRNTDGSFTDYGGSVNPSESNSVFGIKGENNFSANFMVNPVTTHVYAFHWEVNAEL